MAERLATNHKKINLNYETNLVIGPASVDGDC